MAQPHHDMVVSLEPRCLDHLSPSPAGPLPIDRGCLEMGRSPKAISTCVPGQGLAPQVQERLTESRRRKSGPVSRVTCVWGGDRSSNQLNRDR